MKTKEFMKKTYATYRQVDYWCNQGIHIGSNHGKGSGSKRSFTEHDVTVINILVIFSELIGIGAGSEKTLKLKNLSQMLQNRPDIMKDYNILYVTQWGTIAEEPTYGYVIDLRLVKKKLKEHQKSLEKV